VVLLYGDRWNRHNRTGRPAYQSLRRAPRTSGSTPWMTRAKVVSGCNPRSRWRCSELRADSGQRRATVDRKLFCEGLPRRAFLDPITLDCGRTALVNGPAWWLGKYLLRTLRSGSVAGSKTSPQANYSFVMLPKLRRYVQRPVFDLSAAVTLYLRLVRKNEVNLTAKDSMLVCWVLVTTIIRRDRHS
jgi:hypothetical protein